MAGCRGRVEPGTGPGGRAPPAPFDHEGEVGRLADHVAALPVELPARQHLPDLRILVVEEGLDVVCVIPSGRSEPSYGRVMATAAWNFWPAEHEPGPPAPRGRGHVDRARVEQQHGLLALAGDPNLRALGDRFRQGVEGDVAAELRVATVHVDVADAGLLLTSEAGILVRRRRRPTGFSASMPGLAVVVERRVREVELPSGKRAVRVTFQEPAAAAAPTRTTVGGKPPQPAPTLVASMVTSPGPAGHSAEPASFDASPKRSPTKAPFDQRSRGEVTTMRACATGLPTGLPESATSETRTAEDAASSCTAAPALGAGATARAVPALGQVGHAACRLRRRAKRRASGSLRQMHLHRLNQQAAVEGGIQRARGQVRRGFNLPVPRRRQPELRIAVEQVGAVLRLEHQPRFGELHRLGCVVGKADADGGGGRQDTPGSSSSASSCCWSPPPSQRPPTGVPAVDHPDQDGGALHPGRAIGEPGPPDLGERQRGAEGEVRAGLGAGRELQRIDGRGDHERIVPRRPARPTRRR